MQDCSTPVLCASVLFKGTTEASVICTHESVLCTGRKQRMSNMQRTGIAAQAIVTSTLHLRIYLCVRAHIATQAHLSLVHSTRICLHLHPHPHTLNACLIIRTLNTPPPTRTHFNLPPHTHIHPFSTPLPLTPPTHPHTHIHHFSTPLPPPPPTPSPRHT